MRLFLIILGLFFMLTSCEDVIVVKLDEMEPKLVIEASINWVKGSTGSQQRIKLSLSAPFFDGTVPPATGAKVKITDQNNRSYHFIENTDTGIYENSDFIPLVDYLYTLNIIYNDEIYEAFETLEPVVDIDYVAQNISGGLIDETTELKAYYTDPADEINFYLFEFNSPLSFGPSLAVYDDSFTNGNQIFGYYSDKDLLVGDQVIIRNYGISEQFYNYMYILLQQSSDPSGRPFQTQPAVVRGNCINQTNPENFPLGYFTLSQVSEVIYTIQ